jgi:hypothetical protein
VSQFNSGYSINDCDQKFNSCLKKVNNQPADIGAFINKSKEYGFRVYGYANKSTGTESNVPPALLPISSMPITRNSETNEIQIVHKVSPNIERSFFIPDASYTVDIASLESFFESVPMPKGPVKFPRFGIITNPSAFVASHVATMQIMAIGPLLHLLSDYRHLKICYSHNIDYQYNILQ